MASTQQLKSRIRSVKSTKQITKAMQMVAASKMRRAQDATKGSRAYTEAAREILTYLQSQGETDTHRWFVTRPITSRLIIVIAGDKGLAGAYNSNMLKAYVKNLRSDDSDGVHNKTIAVGRKATQFVSRIKGTEVIGTYEEMPDHPGGNYFNAILSSAKDLFEQKQVDAVDVIYTKFVSSVTQTPEVIRLFPAGFVPSDQVSDEVREAIYEPNVERVLDDAAYRLIGAELFQALLDARASEHSMRMLAMKNATDNASDLIDDLTLEMNKARQGAITRTGRNKWWIGGDEMTEAKVPRMEMLSEEQLGLIAKKMEELAISRARLYTMQTIDESLVMEAVAALGLSMNDLTAGQLDSLSDIEAYLENSYLESGENNE